MGTRVSITVIKSEEVSKKDERRIWQWGKGGRGVNYVYEQNCLDEWHRGRIIIGKTYKMKMKDS